MRCGGHHSNSKKFEDPARCDINFADLGIDKEIWGSRLFEAAVLSGKLFDLTSGNFGVEAFGITLGTGFVRRFDVNLFESAADDFTGLVAECPLGRDDRDDGDDTLRGKHFGDFCDPANVFFPVLITEAKVGVQTVAEVVAVEDDDKSPLIMKLPFHGSGDR